MGEWAGAAGDAAAAAELLEEEHFQKTFPFLPSPAQEENPGERCSITDCPARHACKSGHNKLTGKYTENHT